MIASFSVMILFSFFGIVFMNKEDDIYYQLDKCQKCQRKLISPYYHIYIIKDDKKNVLGTAVRCFLCNNDIPSYYEEVKYGK